MSPMQPPPQDPSRPDASVGPWMRKYLTSLLADPALNPPPAGLLPIWIEQQIDPALERGQTTPRITLQHAINRTSAMILLGHSGSGKSAALRQLVREMAQEALANPHAALPLYVPLAFFAGTIEGTLSAQARMRAPSLATLALTRPCILLVDALNDLPAGDQVNVIWQLRRAFSDLGPQGRWLITCRSEDWSHFDAWLPPGRPQVWRTRPWNDQSIMAAVERQALPGCERLLRLAGALELARRPRWLGALLGLREDALPGPLLVSWITATATEAARTHCLSEQCPQVVVGLLQEFGGMLQRQPALSQAAITSIVDDTAAAHGVPAEDLQTLLHALAFLQSTGDDEWTFRSPLLSDLDLALELRPELSTIAATTKGPASESVPAALGGRPAASALLFGMLPSPQPLLRALIRAGAWEATQQVLDANAAPDETLRLLEETGQIDSASAAALGRAWAQGGAPDVALALLEWTVEEGRDDPFLFGLIGQLHRQAGRWAQARTAFEEALRHDHTNLDYQQALAHVCHELGEDDAATKTLKDLLSEHHTRLAGAAFQLGTLLEDQGKLADALDQYTRASALCEHGSADEGRFQIAKARILRQLGRHDDAAHVLRGINEETADPVALTDENAALLEATGHDAQALERLEQIEESGSATPTTYIRMAEILRRREDPSAADRAYRAAVEMDPRRDEAYVGIADLAVESGDLVTAIISFERIVDLHPNSADAWRRLGALQRQAERLSESSRSLQTALRLAPSSETQLELARTRWAQGDQVMAISHYRGATLDDPDGRMAAEAGWALMEVGDLPAAQTMLERAVALRPADGRVLYDLGRCYEAQGSTARALQWYMQAARVSPSATTLRATGRAARLIGERAIARQMLARALRADRRNADTAAEIGRLHLEEGRADLAVVSLRRARAAGLEDLEIQRDLAEALLRLGDAQAALTILEAVPTEDNDLQTKRSRAYELLGDPQSALAIARSAAAHQPRNPILQRRVGALALQAGLPGDALVALEAARTLGDKEISTLVDLSRALLLTNRVTAALRPLDEALQRISHGTPDDPRLHVQRGRVLLAIEDWTEARRSFERAVALNGAAGPAPTAANALLHAEAWSGLAEAYAHLASPGAALPYARHALELVPANGDFIRLVARLLYDVRDYAAARETLLKDRVSEPATLRLRLQVELAAEQWVAAVPLAARCHAIAPNDLRVAAEYGMALLYAGQPREALPLLETACAGPDVAPGWWATLGRCQMRLADYESAVKAFTRSLEGQTDSARTHADLAGAYMRLGMYAQAAHALRQALELGGERVELRAALARALSAQGWYIEALAEWERARVLAPGDTTIRLEIARTRIELGDPEPALVDLEALVADHPDHAIAWQLLSRAALHAGTPSRAVYAASCALSQKPHDVRLRILLAEAAIADGDAQRAYETLTPLSETSEPNVKALLLIHKAANLLGDTSAGRTALEKAGHVAPGDPDVQLAFSEQYLGHGDPERAIKLLRNLLSRFNDNAPVTAAIAGQALRAHELGLARQAAERAVSLSPQDTTYARLLGVICFENGDPVMARRALQQAMKGRPEPTTALMLGKLALDRDETSEATRYLRMAYEYRPDDPETCGWLALALRHPLQPVLEDEAPEPQQNPALDFAVRLLGAAEKEVAYWRAELGWTLVLCGEYREAIAMLSSAARSDDLPDEHRAVTLRRVGLVLLKQGRAGDARTPLERAHELDPSDATACSLLGQVAEIQGEVEDAIQFYSDAVALQPDNGRHHLRLGQALLAVGQTDTALEHLRRAAELEPARATIWTAYSKALLTAGQPEHAYACSHRATQLAPDDGTAWRQHAAVAQSRDDIRGALEALERAVEHAPGAPEDKQWLIYYANLAIANGETERGRNALQSASNLDPNDADLLYELAQLHGTTERLALLQRAVDLQPDRAAWRTELARLLVNRGDHRAALDHLKRAIITEPTQPGNWLALAAAYRQVGDDDAAEETLRQADAEAGPDAEIFIAMGRLLEAQDRWAEALQVYIVAMQLKPTADRHTDCGRCLKVLGRYDEAEEALKMALESAPAHAHAATLMAEVYLLRDPNDGWRSAIRFARIATEFAPAELAGYKLQARAALGGKWNEELKTALEHAYAIAPDDPELHELQGWYYFHEGKTELAMIEAQRAIEFDPEAHTAHYLYAQILRRQQRYREATSALTTAVQLKGNYREALRELAALGFDALIHPGRR